MIGGLCLLDMEQLSKFMKNSNLSKQDKILLILAWNVDHPKYTSDISKIGNQAGGKSVDKWGVYNYLLGMRKTGLVHDKTYGWELTEKGKKFVKEKFNVGRSIMFSNFRRVNVAISIDLCRTYNTAAITTPYINTKNF